MAQTKEQIKTPEKELSCEEIDKLCDAKFKTLVIRMLTELIELGCKMKQQMKATQSEIKQNIRDPTVTGRKLGINGVNQEEETFNQNRMKKQEFRKMKRGSRTSGTTLNGITSNS